MESGRVLTHLQSATYERVTEFEVLSGSLLDLPFKEWMDLTEVPPAAEVSVAA